MVLVCSRDRAHPQSECSDPTRRRSRCPRCWSSPGKCPHPDRVGPADMEDIGVRRYGPGRHIKRLAGQRSEAVGCHDPSEHKHHQAQHPRCQSQSPLCIGLTPSLTGAGACHLSHRTHRGQLGYRHIGPVAVALLSRIHQFLEFGAPAPPCKARRSELHWSRLI